MKTHFSKCFLKCCFNYSVNFENENKVNQSCYSQLVFLIILLFAMYCKMHIHSNLAGQLVELLNTIISDKMEHQINPNIQTVLAW